MKHYLPYLILFITFSCKQEEKHCWPDYRPNFLAEPLVESVVPYEGTETLKFIRNHSDIVFYTGRGKKIYYDTLDLERTDTCRNYETFEHITLTFEDTVNHKQLAYTYYVTLPDSNRVDMVSFYVHEAKLPPIYGAKIFRPGAINETVNNVVYDRVTIHENGQQRIVFKGYLGIIKFTDGADTYELVK